MQAGLCLFFKYKIRFSHNVAHMYMWVEMNIFSTIVKGMPIKVALLWDTMILTGIWCIPKLVGSLLASNLRSHIIFCFDRVSSDLMNGLKVLRVLKQFQMLQERMFKLVDKNLQHSQITPCSFLTLCMMGNFLCFCCHLLKFFQLLKESFQEHYQCQTVYIQIRTLPS